jgi:5-formyltetrahydrofolate cyclo-ligase
MTKEVLRKYYQQKRQQLTSAEKALALSKIEDNFFQLLATFKNIVKIAGYVPMPEELDIRNILQVLSSGGYQILLPVCKDLEMSFCNTQTSLKKDNVPDLIIAPLIACDAFGNRLGYGKGYYDRKISELKQSGHHPIFLGLCYEVQFGVNLPAQLHDQSLDYIITEKNIVKIS